MEKADPAEKPTGYHARTNDYMQPGNGFCINCEIDYSYSYSSRPGNNYLIIITALVLEIIN